MLGSSKVDFKILKFKLVKTNILLFLLHNAKTD